MSSRGKLWQLQPHDAAAIERLARALRISPILSQLLLNRGLSRPEQASRFLQAPMTSFHEPEMLPGIPAAVERLTAALRAREKICIYGDYDVDGVTGTAILVTCLALLEGAVEYFVPHRIEHGYGLRIEALRELASRGVKVVVTVDCGIANLEEADEARRLGIDLIVTDHHEPRPAGFPSAAAVIHPRVPINEAGTSRFYPFGNLCGSAVAFKLAWALCKKHCGSDKVTPQLREFLLDSIALASLGTVADVVPLVDENRVIVRHGLARLRSTPTLGVQELLKVAKLDAKRKLLAGDIGFSLAPRINAAGRLGSADRAVELFTTKTRERAAGLAEFLDEQNQNRQTLERNITIEARQQAQDYADHPALVLASPQWHAGILGIVASRLVEEFCRPVLMIALREGQPFGQGSGRSVPGFALHQALQECTDQLLSHGGHAAAAGFRLLPDLIPRFREQFVGVVSRMLGPTPKRQRMLIDAEVPLSSFTYSVVDSLHQLEPYGAGNPLPLFLADRLQVVGQPRRLGGGERHLSFRVKQDGTSLRAIAFNMGDRLEELMSGAGKCSLVFTPRIGEWQDWRKVELEVRDFRPTTEATLEA